MLITTKVLPATDTLGTRIRAYSPHHKASATVAWDHALGHLDCHAEAAAQLVRKLNATPDAVFRGPYVLIRLIGDAGASVGYAFDAIVESNIGRQASWDSDAKPLS